MSVREQVPTSEDDGGETSTDLSHHEASLSITTAQASAVADETTLSMIQAATLLTADCVGVGILALPKDVKELGWILGIGFLILNLPINYYAGKILAVTATHMEQQGDNNCSNNHKDGIFEMVATSEDITVTEKKQPQQPETKDGILRERKNDLSKTTPPHANVKGTEVVAHKEDSAGEASDEPSPDHHYIEQAASHALVSTQDLVGLTNAVFASAQWSGFVTTLYFLNLFLVLGDYILVMSYAVAAMLGDNICLPWAGVLASILMFAVSQLRTMARLGREASVISLACLLVVVVQCLVSAEEHAEPAKTARTSVVGDSVLLRKFSAFASIGFAMGSQKLLLNIRHEMRHKEEAPTTLVYSLGTFGTAYVVTCILAGRGTCVERYGRGVPSCVIKPRLTVVTGATWFQTLLHFCSKLYPRESLVEQLVCCCGFM